MADTNGPAGSGAKPPAGFNSDETGKQVLWFFMAVQVLFIVWIIAGAGSSGGDATDCGSLSQETCNDAEDIGTGLGVALIVVVWMVVDFLLAVIYGIYRLAKRN
jgi:hypothetical protein